MAGDYYAQFGDQPDPGRHAAADHEAHAEVGAQRIAAVYAEAFLGAAEDAGRIAPLLEEFDSFVADVLDQVPGFEKVLASALVSHEEKAALLDRALTAQASREFLNFLKVVSRHGRLDLLREIHRQARALRERKLGQVRVVVTTAAPVQDDLAQRLVGRLRGLVDGEPVLEQVVDPGILGGIVVRVGDTVYDASIATQLKNLRQQMIDRSAHEIQSRRDRFRSPQ
jgi:F-type H+-transporting ATPase subunit delta